MNPYTLAAFQDELVKIAVSQDAQMVTNASIPPQDDQDKNPDWRQKGGQPGVQKQQPQSETPASKANAFFGLPAGHPRKRNVRDYDQGSAAAASPDRSQSPVDGQSTANISQGGAMYPATGPGGV
jgi:hypothetical protein